ncbi:hypothetical protein NCS52_00744600 [Fusarium sp. LHS14.1]|nr:hypothetical protein NCS52_00744600 [Fusarium sp. LHS14.1]
MEAIGVGANVLAFVLLSIKSAKVAHDTLSAIKDGPKVVRDLTGNVLQLQGILEKLKEPCTAASTDALDGLEGQVRQCTEDLGELAELIQKFQASTRDKFARKLWKRLKVVVGEKDLERFNRQVEQKASLLNVRLSTLSRNQIYEIKDGNDRLEQQIRLMNASVQAQLESQKASFLDTVRGILSGHDDERTALRADLSSIQQAIKALHFISPEATQAILQPLDKINNHTDPEPKDDPETTNPRGDDEHAMDEAAPGSDQKLLEIIDNLCSLINEEKDAVDAYGEDDSLAQSAIENLEELVQSLRGKKLPVSDPKSFGSDLNRFGKWFGSGALSINSGVESTRRPLTRVVEQSQSFSEVNIGAGKIRFMVQKRKRAVGTADHDNDNDTRAKKRCRTDWMMSVAFLPGKGQSRHMLLASLTRQELFTNSMTCISRLQINRVLPVGPLVFELVREGDLEELKEMLQDGEASLQDHDEYGASLLLYSITQPKVCKFLIDSGLDVDHIGGSPGYPESLVTALVAHAPSSSDTEPEEMRRVIECYRLLLHAGADPTLDVGDEHNFLDEAVTDNAPEVIKLAWNPEFVRPFADIKTYRTSFGRSPLLTACRNFNGGYNWQSFHQILKSGASIEDRDELGRTCLHLCIEYSRLPNCDTDLREFEAIQYLVRKGADVRAVNKSGSSVSDIAYTTGAEWGINCSHPGDLWDAVLHSCGYDIAQFRSGYRRRARYTTPAHNQVSPWNYYRHNFEKFWGERWEECPYWDDEPWPPLGPGEEDSDDESQGYECACLFCLKHYPHLQDEESESGSEIDTEEDEESESDSEIDTEDDEEQTSSDDGSVRGHPHRLYVDQGEEQSESDRGHVESDWEETDTLPGFGGLMQGMPSENWQDSPDMGRSTVSTPQSLSMDLENPWL